MGTPQTEHPEVRFAVLDVGQGLAQVAVADSLAILFDMGAAQEFDRWRDGYRALGSPVPKAVVVSHEHPDHYGGLTLLADTLGFQGTVITSPHIDTAFVRAMAGQRKELIAFRTVAQGDTLAVLPGVSILCLWPPRHLDEPYDPNRHSLCFLLRSKETSVLISSDIDTCAQIRLAQQFQWGLEADIVVVPHHGSRTALSPAFYGFIGARSAIISCALDNEFGHPDDRVIRLLNSFAGMKVHETRFEGHIVGYSNGEYWSWTMDGR